MKNLLKEAHDYLANAGQRALQQSGEIKALSWGSELKRIKVALSTDAPLSVTPSLGKQNLVEVINQCATVERLLDVLEWIETEGSGFKDWIVERCHPTTSSSKKAKEEACSSADNDLVLISKNTQQEKACFEVSDVASEEDGNGKEKKDLVSLGVLKSGDSNSCIPSEWPRGRRFLVVSAEFAIGVQRRKRSWRKRGHCHFKETKLEGGRTVLLEVLRGDPENGLTA